jgi:3-deoxy-manno-octulosonate cytidylyltransferase (CMP-KDO synthetase)
VSYIVVIPARYASTRLPGKPLVDIAGKSMIERVYHRACASSAQRVVIATDDRRVAAAAEGFGAEVCMTSAAHESGTDRLQETAQQLGFSDQQCVVNVQGDEPLVPPAIIDQVAHNLQQHESAAIATLSAPMVDAETFHDPNAVKVVTDQQGFALYFSRAPIPWPRDEMMSSATAFPTALVPQRHLGIYAYRVAFLHRFVTWPVSALEAVEKLEQLRALDNGVRIHVAEALEVPPAGVDTVQDLEHLRELLASAP